MKSEYGFLPGALPRLLSEATARARQCGALEPIDTACHFYEDGGVRFLLRLARGSSSKPQPTVSRYQDASVPNPFLPYDESLYVADASPTHVCVLNKYNVVDNHLLIITRQFEHQEAVLNEADFTALWRCLAESESLGFYNSGTVAGASQPHKHLQVVPLPLDGSGSGVPIEALLPETPASFGTIHRHARLPFGHRIVFWEHDPGNAPLAAAQHSVRIYRQMLDLVGLRERPSEPSRIDGAYNLLVTRRWMLLIPRRRECWGTISFNAMAFGGALLVHTPDQFNALCQVGPMAALTAVAAT